MKKKLLPLALAAAAGLTGINSAHAVNVNPAGTGEVLIYPFYTVEGGQDTLFSVVNTTNETKAVKVRILEAMNTQEVLDFNLYLSPQDHWSAAITATSDGAQILTGDTSCTVPLSLSAKSVGATGTPQPFRNFEYVDDEINDGLERTREGYIEIIEMGEVDETDAEAAILHANGLPDDCAFLDAEWKKGAGGIFATQTSNMQEPAGGLYGYGVLIDVAEGTAAGYDAVALEAFSDAALHTNPGSLSPALNQASPATAVVIDGVTARTATFVSGIDAVSAVMMHSAISNDYILDADLNAGTDWVITMPTKREYVNKYALADDILVAPFSSVWNPATTTACEQITISYFDREEGRVTVAPEDNDFSPRPPVAADPVLSLCKEANVVTFNSADVLEATDRVKSNLNLDDGYDAGWLTVGLTTVEASVTTGKTIENFDGVDSTDNPAIDPAVRKLTSYEGGAAPANLGDTNSLTFDGLPVVGFAVQSYVNGANSGTLANYNAALAHKTTTVVTVN
ncbi:hypothetical protein [uncultured Pseudoteredinibacter sp.]|uniref:hypothetical protein n=1 Tax=uncultured Pseudoteredinibacter sp. TaxID=1641701 RepID=UPI002624BE06|nr:hypothetical protein [uncultured Pseudoteredinibacter sp.]